jgi:hypothetical protein
MEVDLELLEDIKGFEGLYQINRKGQIWSIRKKIFMKTTIGLNKNGMRYTRIGLRKNDKTSCLYLHRLMAIQFIPNPLDLPEVDHTDRDSLNNSLNNLRWVDRRANMNNRKLKSKTGETNIYLHRTRFAVRVFTNCKIVCYKSFKTLEEAVLHRDKFVRDNNLNCLVNPLGLK